jgi:proline-specific peptidase
MYLMTTSSIQAEGRIAVPGGNVWYRVAGATAPGAPLLVLHGGPGAGHDYLEPLQALADKRPVVFYDQLGCGRSDIPDDESLWQFGRFVEEVAAVRRALDLDRVHLLGQSWGGWLAIEYMLTGPSGVLSLTLANTSASVDEFVAEALRMVSELPPETRATIKRCEAEGDTQSGDYLAACMAFYQRHLCRLPEWPPETLRSMANVQASPVYRFMWGPSEFTLTGNLAGWDRSDRLAEITTPTLILSGRYDEMGPACQTTLHKGIPGSRLHVFENSSHSPHVEQPDAFFPVLRGFLREAEAA